MNLSVRFAICLLTGACAAVQAADAATIMGPSDLVGITTTNTNFPFAPITAGIDGNTNGTPDLTQAINFRSDLPITTTVTLNSDNIYNVDTFHLWNNFGQAGDGWDAFSLTFYDPMGSQIGPVFNGNGSGGGEMEDVFALGFLYEDVRTVDILLTSKHDQNFDAQFRELAFSGTTSARPVDSAVPEPSSILLWICLGLAGCMAGWVRQKRKARS